MRELGLGVTLALASVVALSGCITFAAPAPAPSSDQAERPAPSPAPLDPAPRLPEVTKSPCPPGLAWCFDDANARALDERLKALKADSLYCREKYEECRAGEEKPE